jgi:hypothetical protein
MMSIGSSHYINDSLLISFASFPFRNKRNIFMGMWEHIKFTRHNTLGFSCLGRSLKTHIENKKRVVYIRLNIIIIFLNYFLFL